MKELQKLATALAGSKFRLTSQGDVLIMRAIASNLNEAAATQIMLNITMAQGKMSSLSQLTPILQELTKAGWVSAKKGVSEATGRPMALYNLTTKGEKVLELSSALIYAMKK